MKPYYFDFLCSVKQRWLGKTIIDVFSEVYNACARAWFFQCQCADKLPAVYVASPSCKLKVLHQTAQVAVALGLFCTVTAENSHVPLLAVIDSLQPKSVLGVCIPPKKLLSRGF